MRIRALVVAPLLLVVLAGCTPGGAPPPLAHYQAPSNGESEKSGPEVAKDGAQALLHGGSATVEGHLTVDGVDQEVKLNLQGEDLSGTVVTGGHAIQIAIANGIAYAKGPADFWSAQDLPEAAAARLADRWVRGADTAVERLTPVSLIWLADEIREPSKASIEDDVRLVTVTHGKLTGTPAVEVDLSDGGVIQVAAAGTPYPIVLEHPGGYDGLLTLSDFDESSPIVPPSSSVDLASVL